MTKPPKLTFVVEAPFTDRDFARFGIEAMQKSCDVSILSLILTSNRQYPEVRTDSFRAAVTVTAPRSYWELWTRIQAEKPEYYIDLVGSSRAAVVTRLAMRAIGCARIISAQGDVPHAMTWDNPRSLRALPGRELVRMLTPTASLAIVGGEAALQRKEVSTADSRLLSQSLDANYFVQLRTSRKSRKLPPQQFAVFVDEGMTDHPDYSHHRVPPPIASDAYYPPLTEFLDNVESALGMQVKIAAHPSSTNPVRLAQFGHRAVEIGRTAELIMDSALVFIHASTARSYAVLADKPLVFLTSKALDESWIGPSIRLGADILKCPLVYIDKLCTPTEARNWLRSQDVEAYADYSRQYLVTGNAQPHGNSWQALVDLICSNSAPSAGLSRSQQPDSMQRT